MRRLTDSYSFTPRRYPETTDDLLAGLVRKIRSVGSPIKVVFFGSRARGDHKADSDIDLLVIEPLPRVSIHAQQQLYNRALHDLYPKTTVLVCTPQDLKDWQHVPNYIITRALSEGKVLWEAVDYSSQACQTHGEPALVAEGESRKTSSDLAKLWFRKAERDLGRSEKMAKQNVDADYEAACFFAQQAVEKYLKGFLALNGLIPEKTHNLPELLEACSRLKPMPDLHDLNLKAISEYALDARYAYEFEPSFEIAHEAASCARSVLGIIYGNVPSEARPDQL